MKKRDIILTILGIAACTETLTVKTCFLMLATEILGLIFVSVNLWGKQLRSSVVTTVTVFLVFIAFSLVLYHSTLSKSPSCETVAGAILFAVAWIPFLLMAAINIIVNWIPADVLFLVIYVLQIGVNTVLSMGPKIMARVFIISVWLIIVLWLLLPEHCALSP